MNCPTCQAALPEDAAFCGHCGGALRSERTCARCGRSNSPEMRFCLGCGAALSPAAPAQAPRTYTPKHLADRILAEQAAMESRGAQDGERKTITALFADIKGSVELIEEHAAAHFRTTSYIVRSQATLTVRRSAGNVAGSCVIFQSGSYVGGMP